MSDEATPQEGTPAPSQEDKIDADELTRLKEQSGKFEKLQTEATGMGFNDVDNYIDYLSDKKLEETKDPPKTVSVTKPIAPVTDNNDEAMQMATASYLESQHTQYKMDQNDLSKEERSSFTKTELTKLIRGPKRVAIQELATHDEFQGNLYTAADYLMNISSIKEKARKEGADSEKVLNDAKETASSVTGTAPAPEGEKDLDQQLADIIAPKTVDEFD